MPEVRTDIQCCQCKSWSRDIEYLTDNYTVQSGFTRPASESCDNCGHDFCTKCIREVKN